jgi:hypothetical protein
MASACPLRLAPSVPAFFLWAFLALRAEQHMIKHSSARSAAPLPAAMMMFGVDWNQSRACSCHALAPAGAWEGLGDSDTLTNGSNDSVGDNSVSLSTKVDAGEVGLASGDAARIGDRDGVRVTGTEAPTLRETVRELLRKLVEVGVLVLVPLNTGDLETA